MTDALFDVKNAFYLGNYQQCIKEASKSTSPDLAVEQKCYLYRSYIAQKKYRIALDEITPSSDARLQAIRIYADYMANEKKRYVCSLLGPHLFLCRPQILAALENQTTNTTDMFCLMAAIMYANETVGQDLCTQTYYVCAELRRRTACTASGRRCAGMLRTSRAVHVEDQSRRLGIVGARSHLYGIHASFCRKEVKHMQEIDEDATITQLALAWTNMVVVGLVLCGRGVLKHGCLQGKEKLQDAFYIYQEMMDKYGQTPMLLAAQAGTLILQHKYEQAEELLQVIRRVPHSQIYPCHRRRCNVIRATPRR